MFINFCAHSQTTAHYSLLYMHLLGHLTFVCTPDSTFVFKRLFTWWNMSLVVHIVDEWQKDLKLLKLLSSITLFLLLLS